MAAVFSDFLLRKATAEGMPRREIWDQRIPGFGMRISAAGTKSFILVYRHRGRTRRLTLGRYPFLSLAEAREKATEALRALSSGSDPAFAREIADDATFQFEAVLDRFIARHCRVHNKASTAKEHERLLRKHFASRWRRRDIRDVTGIDVNVVLDQLIDAGTPSEANHALDLPGFSGERIALPVTVSGAPPRRLSG